MMRLGAGAQSSAETEEEGGFLSPLSPPVVSASADTEKGNMLAAASADTERGNMLAAASAAAEKGKISAAAERGNIFAAVSAPAEKKKIAEAPAETEKTSAPAEAHNSIAEAVTAQTAGGARLIRARLGNGRSICIKYPLGAQAAGEPSAAGAWRGRLAAALLAKPFLRVLPPLAPAERAALEQAKLAQFQAAGLPVAQILAARQSFSIFADAGKSVAEALAALRAGSPALHDSLLVRCAESLGRVHAAGLCLGQPDWGNMFLAAHGIGFSGFQDYPERFMPREAAQMRDIWQFLPLLAESAADADYAAAAGFRAWRRQVGPGVLEALRGNAGFFRLLLRRYRLFSPLLPGKQRESGLTALRFLAANLGI